jgi:hypothetical protein
MDENKEVDVFVIPVGQILGDFWKTLADLSTIRRTDRSGVLSEKLDR